MNEEMVRNCKSDIAKFGFSGQDYIKFLISVCAMKDENTVVKFMISDFEEYYNKFVKKNEVGIEDSFEFDKCKIKNGGYFFPRSFWDRILSIQS